METLQSVRDTIQPDDYTITIDLKDAYLHIPLHPTIRHLFRLLSKGTIYQFTVLPFGLSTAPRISSLLHRPVIAQIKIHLRRIRGHAYLDNWLVRNQSRVLLEEHSGHFLNLFAHLGLGVNYPKSQLIPHKQFVFLGATFDTSLFRVRPSKGRVECTTSMLQSLCESSSTTARKLSSAIGQVDSRCP